MNGAAMSHLQHTADTRTSHFTEPRTPTIFAARSCLSQVDSFLLGHELQEDLAAPAELNFTATDVPWSTDDRAVWPSNAMEYTLQSEADQVAQMLQDEQFGELNLNELEEDERLCDIQSPDKAHNFTAANELTGVCEVDEITIR